MFIQLKITAYVIASLLLLGLWVSNVQRVQKIKQLQNDLTAAQTERNQTQVQLQQALIAQVQMQSQLDQWQKQAQAKQRTLAIALQQEQQWANQKLPEKVKKAIIQ